MGYNQEKIKQKTDTRSEAIVWYQKWSKELIPKMKQSTDTQNEAKYWYQKWSKELIPKLKQRTDTKNGAKYWYQKWSKEDFGCTNIFFADLNLRSCIKSRRVRFHSNETEFQMRFYTSGTLKG